MVKIKAGRDGGEKNMCSTLTETRARTWKLPLFRNVSLSVAVDNLVQFHNSKIFDS